MSPRIGVCLVCEFVVGFFECLVGVEDADFVVEDDVGVCSVVVGWGDHVCVFVWGHVPFVWVLVGVVKIVTESF